MARLNEIISHLNEMFVVLISVPISFLNFFSVKYWKGKISFLNDIYVISTSIPFYIA